MLKLPFKKLLIWQKGLDLAKLAYLLTNDFPKEEIYGLNTQMRRCAVSVPSNIAEGSQRTSNKEFANFILIAKSSLAELETQMILSKELGFIMNSEENVSGKINELSRMLFAFHKKLTTTH